MISFKGKNFGRFRHTNSSVDEWEEILVFYYAEAWPRNVQNVYTSFVNTLF